VGPRGGSEPAVWGAVHDVNACIIVTLWAPWHQIEPAGCRHRLHTCVCISLAHSQDRLTVLLWSTPAASYESG
jgi:hypothetical protein